DTVGFIRKLPVTLVKAFRATLEEVTEAALILHVVDVSAPQAAAQMAQVEKVLADIGAGSTPRLLVFNKADLLAGQDTDPQALIRRLAGDQAPSADRAVLVSALTGQGLARLLAIMDEVLSFDPISRATFRFPAADASKAGLLYHLGRVLSARFDGDGYQVEAEVPHSLKLRLAQYLVESC
ncbi:MAG: GTPase HflX, partial [Bryobacteraceae bacterium]